MLLSAIQSEIITEVGGDTSDTALQTKVLGFINSAQRKFPIWARVLFMYTTKSKLLSSGQYTFTLPTGIIEIRDVYYIEEGNRLRIEKPISNEYFNDVFNSNATGAPKLYRVVGIDVEFDRTADKDYTIYFECLQEKDAFLTTDTFIRNSTVVEVLKDGAKSYYYRYVEDDVASKDFLQLFITGLNELDAKYMEQTLGSHINEE